ncbi:MAG: DUF2798 domain-containing protein [Elstera sp.]
MAFAASASPATRARLAQVTFGLLLSGMMSCVVSGIATARALGLAETFADFGAFFGTWMGAWVVSWAIAFPTVLVVAPFVRKIVARLYGSA